MSHKEIVEYSRKVLKRSGTRWKTSVTFAELSTANYEIPDILGLASRYSSLIEAKASRSDFLSDKNKFFRKHPERGMGNYRFYACPKNLIKPEELPEKWGLIYLSPKGRCTIIVKPEWQESDIKAEHNFMYSIIRRIIIYSSLTDIDNFIKKYSDYGERQKNIQPIS